MVVDFADFWRVIELSLTLLIVAILRRIMKAIDSNGGVAKRVKKRPKKNGQHPDWYTPPDLN